MRTQTLTSISPKTRQRGAVLAISLLVLLVLTLLGISSLDGSIMEEKMAANAQISTTVFQEADSAVLQAFYQEKLNTSKDRPAAVNTARNGSFAGLSANSNSTPSSNPHNITKSAEFVYPIKASKTPLYNSSAGTFVAHGIEIIGKANIGNIESVSRQGYSIYPMRP